MSGRHISALTPSATASAAKPMACAGVAAETPATTGPRPSTAATMAASTSRRSAALMLPASPIVPVPTMPWTPASKRARTLACSAAVSTAPEESNGVVTAGRMPGKRMGLLIECHVAADPLDVLGGVEGGRVGVAVDDGLVDHAVLGRVQLGPTGHGDRLVAQALPQWLVHGRRDVIGERAEHRGVSHYGDLGGGKAGSPRSI